LWHAFVEELECAIDRKPMTVRLVGRGVAHGCLLEQVRALCLPLIVSEPAKVPALLLRKRHGLCTRNIRRRLRRALDIEGVRVGNALPRDGDELKVKPPPWTFFCRRRSTTEGQDEGRHKPQEAPQQHGLFAPLVPAKPTTVSGLGEKKTSVQSINPSYSLHPWLGNREVFGRSLCSRGGGGRGRKEGGEGERSREREVEKGNVLCYRHTRFIDYPHKNSLSPRLEVDRPDAHKKAGPYHALHDHLHNSVRLTRPRLLHVFSVP
jgi:hypothetical protein